MNRFLFTLLLLLGVCASLIGQGFNYQAVVRDAQGAPLANQEVTFRFSYAPASDTSSSVFTETFDVTTNEFGLATLTLTLGNPQAGTPEDLDFMTTRYWLRTEVDVDGGTNFETMGIAPFQNVPYAQSAPGAGGTVLDGTYSSNCLTSDDGLRACVWTIGGAATSLTGSGSAGYVLTTDSPNDPLKIVIEGNSSTSDESGDFFFTVARNGDGPVGYYGIQLYDLTNDSAVDNYLTGNIFNQELTSEGIRILIPNIGGNYPNGFRLIAN